ncbi:hypothetical protein JO972_04660 [Verrucomicrobiaceae bacterium 5K15]|uniref:Uncharacterized protein n=1 Tax=Oceaniferula flava TaxID=2800421 RepID=A0AAE2VD76_9BACT|nr:hypothetical protein [Oceaniferula flavus]MBK1854234.1 hypothetical protein [Oceaniferula flavus]MBM1135540.1 hypothetical protein [Oceaniferula flavus]
MKTQDKKMVRLILLLSGLLSAIGLAQEAENKGRPVKLMYYLAPADAPSEAYLYAGGKQVAQTELTRTNFSETFKIPQGDLLLRFLSSPLAEGQRLPKRAPLVRIPEKWQKVLLLVFEDPKNRVMPIRIQAINASDRHFGLGSIYMMNFSEAGVVGSIGDKHLKLKPKSLKIVKNPVQKNGYYPVKLNAVIRGEKKPRRLVKQMWSHSDRIRNVLFIMPKPAPQHTTYYCAPIRDF